MSSLTLSVLGAPTLGTPAIARSTGRSGPAARASALAGYRVGVIAQTVITRVQSRELDH
jgi:hypothetical protein